jgi:hypothetical protein
MSSRKKAGALAFPVIVFTPPLPFSMHNMLLLPVNPEIPFNEQTGACFEQ